MSFYTREEFARQMWEVMDQGYGYVDAFQIVQGRETRDEEEYCRWLDSQQAHEELADLDAEHYGYHGA